MNKETVALNDRLDQRDLIDIFRALHPQIEDYTCFSSAHEMFFRIDHMLRHKTSLNKFKKIEIISSISSDHNAMKLEINHKDTEKHAKIWNLNNMFLNNEWSTMRSKKKSKNTLKQITMRTQQSKICGILGKIS